MNNIVVDTLAWSDLAVPNAQQISEFYAAVVGWQQNPVYI
jgi:predicted enzyme related to lactoylglutathione lyase